MKNSTRLLSATGLALIMTTGLGHAQDEAMALVESAGKVEGTEFCGDQPIVLGIHDGFGINGWSKASMAAVRSEAAKCDNVEQLVQIGQMDLQKSIADVNSMISQGIDGLVIIPDWGRAQLNSLVSATDAGVKVVPWGADPGGEDGTDYVAYLDWDEAAAGRAWAQWVVDATGGEGNVVFIGGPAGNPVSGNALAGIEEVFTENPGINLLTGYDEWPVGNWDAAQIQQAMSALLSQYSDIDAVISDAGGFESLGVVRAYEAADRPLVPLASLEANELACTYEKLKDSEEGFELGTISGRNWIGRVAARKAIAAVAGIENNEPNTFELGIYESSLDGSERQPTCDGDLPPDGFVSSQLTPEELDTYGSTE